MAKKRNESKIEKQIKLIKYLHEPHTTIEIEEKLGIPEKTSRDYFSANTIEFLNVTFPIYKRKIKGENRFLSHASETDESGNWTIEASNKEYRSTVNPIFLALNMTEVYTMTNQLLDIIQETQNYGVYQTYKSIIEKIYSQLSDYAKLQIGENRHQLEAKDTMDFIKEDELLQNNRMAQLIHGQKPGVKLKVKLVGEKSFVATVDYKDNEYWLVVNRNEKYKYSEIEDDILSIEMIY